MLANRKFVKIYPSWKFKERGRLI